MAKRKTATIAKTKTVTIAKGFVATFNSKLATRFFFWDTKTMRVGGGRFEQRPAVKCLSCGAIYANHIVFVPDGRDDECIVSYPRMRQIRKQLKPICNFK